MKDIVKLAITNTMTLDTRPKNLNMFVSNCGYSILHNQPWPFAGMPENNYLLLYQHKGRLALPSESSETIIEEGTVILFYPGEKRVYRFFDDEVNERYFVYFEGNNLNVLNQLDLLKYGKILHTGSIPECIPHFKNIISDFAVTPYCENVYRFISLMNILAIISKKMKNNLVPTNENVKFIPQEIVAIAQYIADYNGSLNMEHISKKFAISPATLSRLFHKWYKTSPIEYYHQIRYKKAVTFLISSSLPISNIAYYLGFNDPLYFSKFFKKRSGLSPLEYRKKYGINKY